MTLAPPRPVNWNDVRRMRDVRPDLGCAEIAEQLTARGFVTGGKTTMVAYVSVVFCRRGWSNPKGKTAPGRATWQHVEAVRLAHPTWRCARIAEQLRADGLSADRSQKSVAGWVRATFQRRGWPNPGSYDPLMRLEAEAELLRLRPELLRIRERAREMVGQGERDRDADRVDEIAPPVFSDRALAREERRNRFRMTGDFD